MTIKMIHPKTGVVREIDEGSVKLMILERAGFVPLEGYKAPVVEIPESEPSLAEVIEGQREKMEVAGIEVAAEKAIHAEVSFPASLKVLISQAAQELIDEYELDPFLIEGTGKGGKIVKSDVLEYLESVKEEEMEDISILGTGLADDEIDMRTVGEGSPIEEE